jgi:hypothetical protein
MNIFALDPFIAPGTLGDAGPFIESKAAAWMGAGDCKKFLDMAETYTRLSNKTEKSEDTRKKAAEYAAGCMTYYSQCMEGKAQTAVQTIVQQQISSQSPTVDPLIPISPVQGGSWASGNKWLLIGGGVAVMALIVFLIARKK